MAVLEITTGIGCRNNCVYCPQQKLIEAYKKRSDVFKMTFDVFKRCIDRLPKEIEVEFSGMSEPWLNSDCTRMLKYAHERGHKVNVFTTLVGMSKEDFDEIKEIPFGCFWLHLPSKEGYEEIKVDNDYLELLRYVYNSLRNDKNIKIPFHVRGEEAHPEVVKILGEKIKKRKFSTRAKNVLVGKLAIPKKKKGIISCSRGLRHNVLLPNGDVALCCMDYGLRHILGNLLERPYEELFKGREFKAVMEGLKKSRADILCRYCDMFVVNMDFKAKFYNSLAEVNDLKTFCSLIKKIIKL